MEIIILIGFFLSIILCFFMYYLYLTYRDKRLFVKPLTINPATYPFKKGIDFTWTEENYLCRPVTYTHKDNKIIYKITVTPMMRNCGLFHLSGLLLKGGTWESKKSFLISILEMYTLRSNFFRKQGRMFIFTIKPENEQMIRLAKKVKAKQLANYHNIRGSKGLQVWAIVLR